MEFKLIVTDPDTILNSLSREVKETIADGKEVTERVLALSEEVKYVLVNNIRRRMTPHPLKIRADVEMKFFQFDDTKAHRILIKYKVHEEEQPRKDRGLIQLLALELKG
ncbi:hypothetical protein L2E82_45899 [Cichorium intybus]|uniref:Uncharacterized protein n=1 Tax=Cichorium intybus TaxID=13427 RepID=A0ACB8ZTD4_CICIN|nr:hypothetical protein L2E82_45899 [Cichorium intybus]